MRNLPLARRALLALAVASAAAAAAAAAGAQNQPFPVFDTKPVITHGPYLVDPTETAVTVVWTTDTPSHSEVRYGTGEALDWRAEAARHGLLPVCTLHAIRVTGLVPGRTYNYRVVSTRVVKLKAYWPEKGLPVESATYSFTTLDRNKPTASFTVVTDTHEDIPRITALMLRVDWKTTDFLVHDGDAFDWMDTEDQLFAKWLDPIGRGLAHARALVSVRGNHETRGPFARELFSYVPLEGGEFYSARDDGPMHLMVLDTGEDKPDSTNVYARLNRAEPYLAEELRWFADHAKASARFASAPFRVVLMHQPNWGSMPGGAAKWRALANETGVDLVISGHTHRFARRDAGANGAGFTQLVLGQDQLARVVVSTDSISVVVESSTGERVDAFAIPRRRR